MSKRSLTQLIIFIVIIVVTTATFFYFKNAIIQFNLPQLDNVGDLIARLPKIEQLAQEIKKTISLPEPLRFLDGPADGFLTQAGIVTWTNSQRRKNSLPKLQLSAKLSQAAQTKLEDMFSDQYFGHIAPTGEGPADWIELAGYEYVRTGENLALGNFEDDQDLVQAWMDSPGHRENILTPQFEEIGVAVGQGIFEGQTTWLAVQIFGQPLSACPTIDEDLKIAIDSNQINLNNLKQEIDSLQKEINRTKPRGRRANPQIIESYNALIGKYNDLAEQYNTISSKTENYINQYNLQIKAFNQCANS